MKFIYLLKPVLVKSLLTARKRNQIHIALSRNTFRYGWIQVLKLGICILSYVGSASLCINFILMLGLFKWRKDCANSCTVTSYHRGNLSSRGALLAWKLRYWANFDWPNHFLYPFLKQSPWVCPSSATSSIQITLEIISFSGGKESFPKGDAIIGKRRNGCLSSKNTA